MLWFLNNIRIRTLYFHYIDVFYIKLSPIFKFLLQDKYSIGIPIIPETYNRISFDSNGESIITQYTTEGYQLFVIIHNI